MQITVKMLWYAWFVKMFLFLKLAIKIKITVSISILSLLYFSSSFCCMYSLVFWYSTIISSINSKSIFVLCFSIFCNWLVHYLLLQDLWVLCHWFPFCWLCYSMQCWLCYSMQCWWIFWWIAIHKFDVIE